MIIRAARPDEADMLSELALRSKGHWGYSQDFLDACRDELTVSTDLINAADHFCWVAEDSGTVTGFYTLEPESPGRYELGALFVEPAQIGRGIGRQLIQHAIQALKTLGAEILTIQGDPNAEAFYLAAGGTLVGTRESGSIPGRTLPLFEIRLKND